MIIMSVDLGSVRTGVAISDKDEKFAFPRKVITERNRDRLISSLCDIAKAEKAELIVVGFPRNMDGSVGFKADECKKTANLIKEASGINVELWDERCTTVSAHEALNINDVRGKKRKNVVDSVAAVMILEDYLRYRANNKN